MSRTTLRPAQVALALAEANLAARLEQLALRIAGGDEGAWLEYGQLAAALAMVVPQTAPGADRAMTTQEMADTFGLTTRTARRKGLRGELPVAPLRLGPGARAKIRWAAR